jgi:hypothetical protein
VFTTAVFTAAAFTAAAFTAAAFIATAMSSWSTSLGPRRDPVAVAPSSLDVIVCRGVLLEFCIIVYCRTWRVIGFVYAVLLEISICSSPSTEIEKWWSYFGVGVGHVP